MMSKAAPSGDNILEKDTARPALGFGCSSLMGHRTTSERSALLGAAFESGIRHFDVARFYGYGEAEGALGDFIKSRRAQVTVTTKFGISPPKQSSSLKSILGLARRVAAKSPLLRRGMAGSAGKFIKSGDFSVAAARSSLETSLRLLQTDYIDFYLLHDCRAEDATEELLQFLQAAVREGKIRRFGLGTSIEVIGGLCCSAPEYAGVVQFENSALRQNLALLPPSEGRAVFTHRALNESFDEVWRFFTSDTDAAGRWSRMLGADCTDRAVVGSLLLNYAVQANAGGTVLFSSRSESRIQSNARAVADAPFSADQLRLFAEIAEELALKTKGKV